MKAEYINSFYKAAKDVFQLMVDIEPQRGELKLVENLCNNKDANIELGVVGDLKGKILFSFPKDMTLEMVKILSGMEMDKIDNFASSALGEMANIIGGNALTLLSQYNYTCDIVPPQIYIGEYKPNSIGNDKALQLPLLTPIGEFDITILLKENK
ncbi:MAG TPA: chemotaxis protein CheX [Hungateiclostridium thermocellum]|jgi:chemotaxis protein CheX|uniref:CheC domain protein n=2 Tax=Acetivibrio thermocellus TaxID=1515 RepID=A3DHT1_ACET2|nr:chemotaxis protein CheX [Acetivibrio thermocellus]CDG36828.1 CheC-like protein [Acetivibrio thermocellus BC1]ABN53510.1 CheC domain protein [Acetivibrio thermocellus ATCC 27405]ADU75959.1 CheC domain protein [Acetivibrio thermocellus DSM 1313]ALX09994.1 putative chemotaxis phosphatase, CheX [Acetivibrio thermocellus AD2]ANV77768.1 putative chemotaxis phosphatase, CheX [Acetivibrio thermocellus DSM 2360]